MQPGPANQPVLEELYTRFQDDPESVDPSWRFFFEGMEYGFSEAEAGEGAAPSELRIHLLVQAYRTFGHLLAQVNPINAHPVPEVPELQLATLGFKESELDTPFPTGGLLATPEAPLRAIIERLRAIYCGTVGYEFTGSGNAELEKFIQERIEPASGALTLTLDQKRQILANLNHAELFEIFLHTKYVGQKRFSLEGGETLIPLLHAMVAAGGEEGMDEFVIGMAHRGRLNVLVNLLNKSYANIFHEFEDTLVKGSFEGSGDVKYHKGYSADIETPSGKNVHLSLAANPSHLESVNPVIEGQVRAKQVLKGDDVEMKRIAPIVIHGDAALSGQGIVYETMEMSDLSGYGVGGTLHVVVNNQIGFTTLPKDSRSTRYCTDIAKTFGAPVFHVNAEDAEGCVIAALLAIHIRQRFQIDVFVDLNCYRKYGHNESDEPAFTQPLEYAMIRSKASPRAIYRDQLIEQGIIERQVADELEKEFRGKLETELDEVQTLKTEPAPDSATPTWQEIRDATHHEDPFQRVETAYPAARLIELAEAFCSVPEGLNLHRKIAKLAQERLAMVHGDPDAKTINWGMAETLAYAATLDQGIHIRLSGQDTRRGTFTHRQAVWVDNKKEWRYFPLNHLSEKQGRFDIFNSPLSEYACLGFEYGYSLSYPNALVLWEAQFGDFANGAQIIVDQYLSTSEQKWGRISGLVMLLPHGYEGQGPEHSSARIERYLQLAGDNNMRIANPTTPAQMYHLLRRQAIRAGRRPLIVFTPKALLRHPACVSSLDELASGTFEEILDDPTTPKAKRLVFCSGSVYYDLIAQREKRGVTDLAIIRLEQLYPLDGVRLKALIKQYADVEEYYWVQEEPENMGAWDYIRPIAREWVEGGLQYIGRPRSASPSTGSPRKHKAELAEIHRQLFGEGE